ncbi:MAG: 16S rRNA U1498 N3-methylase RsmE [Candidatus Midichloria mitochondrii]|uniref:Ribosomal RNA small subunit methyltransferase E n=1 Tax=Midichloria mitochondrii (strain IricVA) TaxID=696127 RepID=F7XVG0_MIDMI|nr:RsmE family RNA methyltransferase [Candidatus Midichloria mitochondrii]AEI88659.1 16S ribosomal RNA methyltransferase RsmE [Candidatus Midichloria mitochondrii IricVA]MDJ1256908.1 16S rRNA (uracil(1498)-N(3))-methyltransferase [Candidatus Midichloria mitochondrii]MDJ1288651.1 16S rRNA (uracil(1498)-N(3))-methyltransferase [Candidatus Midichloria mitochondrii]MDJ1299482.1 16S rRNA (uracil(1498)-N(3))-methyltransferase [Candidatus Midichloria mitochondrii]MDJ1313467.1 16S rRNA (uracil(1498)-N
MAKSLVRLYISANLATDEILELSGKSYNYLINVMRKRLGDEVVVFNSQNGEFITSIRQITKKSLTLEITALSKEKVEIRRHLTLAFSPLKGDNNSLIIQKATELGINQITPVLTDRTIVRSINNEKLLSIAIEAAEQSERVDLPDILQPVGLSKLFDNKYDLAIFCDEQERNASIFDVLDKDFCAILVLVGPEGGFTDNEREFLLSKQEVRAVCLNHNILRAETAVISAISVVQSFFL